MKTIKVVEEWTDETESKVYYPGIFRVEDAVAARAAKANVLAKQTKPRKPTKAQQTALAKAKEELKAANDRVKALEAEGSKLIAAFNAFTGEDTPDAETIADVIAQLEAPAGS